MSISFELNAKYVDIKNKAFTNSFTPFFDGYTKRLLEKEDDSTFERDLIGASLVDNTNSTKTHLSFNPRNELKFTSIYPAGFSKKPLVITTQDLKHYWHQSHGGFINNFVVTVTGGHYTITNQDSDEPELMDFFYTKRNNKQQQVFVDHIVGFTLKSISNPNGNVPLKVKFTYRLEFIPQKGYALHSIILQPNSYDANSLRFYLLILRQLANSQGKRLIDSFANQHNIKLFETIKSSSESAIEAKLVNKTTFIRRKLPTSSSKNLDNKQVLLDATKILQSPFKARVFWEKHKNNFHLTSLVTLGSLLTVGGMVLAASLFTGVAMLAGITSLVMLGGIAFTGAGALITAVAAVAAGVLLAQKDSRKQKEARINALLPPLSQPSLQPEQDDSVQPAKPFQPLGVTRSVSEGGSTPPIQLQLFMKKGGVKDHLLHTPINDDRSNIGAKANEILTEAEKLKITATSSTSAILGSSRFFAPEQSAIELSEISSLSPSRRA